MKLKTLNGAPLRANLDFSPEALLHPDAAAHFLHQGAIHSMGVEDAPLKWRHITPKEQRLRSGWSQPYLPKGSFHGSDLDISFSIPGVGASLDAGREDTTMTLQDATFEESELVHHSLVFHDTLLSSQIASGGEADHAASDSSFIGSSFASTTSTDLDSFQHSNTDGPILQVPTTLKLTPLSALPNAAHLRSIYPQIPTLNLLCALAAPPEDKEVFVKKRGYKMQLREITVADDTRGGFKITFWQRPSTGREPQNALRQALQRVRAGDILLLRNIALSTFRDNVYGHSLNLSITRVQTSLEVLMSGTGISSRQLAALPAPVLAAFMRVKKWANIHVASDIQRKRKDESQISNRSAKRSSRSAGNHDETLPPDTMETV